MLSYNFYKIVLLIIWPFDVHFAIQGLKMVKTKELSGDMPDIIIERHKGGRDYRKISKEMKYSRIYHQKVKEVWRQYKKWKVCWKINAR